MFPYQYGNYGNPLSAFYNAPNTQYTAPIRHFLKPSNDNRRCISKAEADFMAMNRLLWMEHVNWTRMTIISIVFGLPDLPFVQERLLRNATDLGNCLRPFYGDQIADRYAELIKEHLILAAQLVTAAAKGDAATAEAKEKEWYRNADEIAIFLNQINPYLSVEAVQKMFYTHLALTKKEAETMIQKNYQADVQIFDVIEAEALAMSDMIASAIVMQFCYLFY
ncbi:MULTISPECIES: hypothetical protein [unclassified Lysinibacillus]|uniref:hypothetical protein n=1 Tax=unclassified Lysinibacillus TaxID=2636778 RepID=UPI0025553C73|nr:MULTISPECIES: hypothetical protein [unclassified Lysinibacillus]MDM5249642.1 hypothetical protein [Lysinibacillus sp. G4S2]